MHFNLRVFLNNAFSSFLKTCLFSGCKLLYKHDFTKRLGLRCVTCSYCSQMCKRVAAKEIDGKARDFCSDDCCKRFIDWYFKVSVIYRISVFFTFHYCRQFKSQNKLQIVPFFEIRSIPRKQRELCGQGRVYEGKIVDDDLSDVFILL